MGCSSSSLDSKKRKIFNSNYSDSKKSKAKKMYSIERSVDPVAKPKKTIDGLSRNSLTLKANGGTFSPLDPAASSNASGDIDSADTADNNSPKARGKKVAHSLSPTLSTRRKSIEVKVELIFQSKRANVYTPGVTLDNRINYKPKNIKKPDAQMKFICKYNNMYMIIDEQ